MVYVRYLDVRTISVNLFPLPPQSELFQDDLYPDTSGDTAAIEAEEWIAGKNATPIQVST